MKVNDMTDTVTEQSIRLLAASVVETCTSCPTIFKGIDQDDNDFVLHYRYGQLTVTRNSADMLSVQVNDATSDGICTLDQACRAAGITLIEAMAA